jgi:hypothetical protein
MACRTGVLLFALLAITFGYPQTQSVSNETLSSSCTFSDNTQLDVRYGPMPVGKENLKEGSWGPGDLPMLLFTQSKLRVSGTEVPVGAYSMYIIPEGKDLLLAINRNVTEGAAYDKTEDLVRTKMETGHLSTPVESTQVSFAHVADKQCNLRLYRGDVGAWAEFKED